MYDYMFLDTLDQTDYLNYLNCKW